MGGSPSILVNVPGLEGTKQNFWAWRYSFSCGSKGHKSDWELPPNLGVSRVADSKSHIQVIISQLCRNSVRTLTRHVQTKAWRHQTAASGAVMNAEAPLHCTGAVGAESTRTAVANDRWGLWGAPPAYLLIPIRLPVCECGIEGGFPSILVNSDTTACGAVNAELRGAPPAYLLIPIRLPVALWMRNWEFKKRAQPAASPWGCQQIENLRDWRLLSTVLLYQDWAKLLPVWGSPLSAAGDSVMNPISNFPVLVRKPVKFFQEKGLPQNNCQEGGHPTRRPGTLGLSLSTVVWGWLANVSLSYVCLALLLATMSSMAPFRLAVVLAVLSSTAPFCLALLLCCWHCSTIREKVTVTWSCNGLWCCCFRAMQDNPRELLSCGGKTLGWSGFLYEGHCLNGYKS